MLPDAIQNLIYQMARLPGIGEKTATRLALHVLSTPGGMAGELAAALLEVQERIRPCSRCGLLTEEDPCSICTSHRRDPDLLCVVEGPAELLAVERSGAYKGRYHVLGGLISPLSGVGPEDLRVDRLLDRVRQQPPREVILALATSVDGEATALYLHHRLLPFEVRCSRLAWGLPIGAELRYADEGTLARALEDRRDMESRS